jgi:hypothetical protein
MILIPFTVGYRFDIGLDLRMAAASLVFVCPGLLRTNHLPFS